MPDLKSLGLKKESFEGSDDLDNLPEQGPAPEPPVPAGGPYLLRLPPAAALKNPARWSKFTGKVKDQDKERIAVALKEDAALTIVEAPSFAAELVGSSNNARWTNLERKRDKDGNVYASDFDYVLKALGEKKRPAGNEGFAAAFEKHGGETLIADSEWSAQCRDDKEVWMVNEETGQTQKVDGQMGCGARYYQSQIPKEQGHPLERFQCQCGASLRAFSNWTRFRPAVGKSAAPVA